MPIETQRRGVVAELATADFEDSPSEVLHRLTGMHVDAGGQDGTDVHKRGVALQHPVGDEDQPVANLQWQRLHPVAPPVPNPERRVSLQVKLIDPPVPNP